MKRYREIILYMYIKIYVFKKYLGIQNVGVVWCKICFIFVNISVYNKVMVNMCLFFFCGFESL